VWYNCTMRTSLAKPVIVSLFLIFSVFAGLWFGFQGDKVTNSFNFGKLRMIKISGVSLTVEVADNKSEWTKGLSGRDRLQINRGMLFVFPREDYYKIWMKNMNFPIDIFWVNKDGVIVDIYKNAMPDSYPNTFSPSRKAMYIIETNADFASVYDIQVGDKVDKLPR